MDHRLTCKPETERICAVPVFLTSSIRELSMPDTSPSIKPVIKPEVFCGRLSFMLSVMYSLA